MFLVVTHELPVEKPSMIDKTIWHRRRTEQLGVGIRVGLQCNAAACLDYMRRGRC